MARPTIYSEELATTICTRLSIGESLRSICRDETMPALSTALAWVVDGNHPQFSEQYARAREAQAHSHVDEMLDMRQGILDGSIEPQAARVISDMIKWSSERMARKQFGSKAEDEAPNDDMAATLRALVDKLPA